MLYSNKELIDDIKNGLRDEIELLEYVTSNDIRIAIAVAEFKWASEPIVDIAAHDLDSNVRRAALCNPNIGRKTVAMLTIDDDP